jgi:Flp pilus assembly pilin Flp
LIFHREIPVKSNLSSRTVPKLLADESGGEVLEYALILGLVSIAAIVTIGAFGTKLLARWGSINSSM